MKKITCKELAELCHDIIKHYCSNRPLGGKAKENII